MNAKQLREIKRAADRFDRAAAITSKAYEDLRATFPEYAMGADRGVIAAAARVTDDAVDGARNYRVTLERVIKEENR